MPAKLTPMMERYLAVKSENPGALLLFRMGDFYELFHEDAETAAKVLGLTLTSRDKGSANPTPMAGFPYHALQTHLQSLIRAGFRVAVCEQVEDPKQAKGMVRREVTQVVTPGTLTEEALLDPQSNNYLASLQIDTSSGQSRVGLAWVDVSTGRFVVADFQEEHLADEFSRLAPAECLVPESLELPAELEQAVGGTLWTTRPGRAFSPESARRSLLAQFAAHSLEGLDLEDDSPGMAAAGALLAYVYETQKTALGHITRCERFRREAAMIIDEATHRSLELTRTIRDGARAGSLLAILDETVTPMGSRKIADWLAAPLTDKTKIDERLAVVATLKADPVLCRDLRDQLGQAYDLERLTGRVATRRANPRDLRCLSRTLALLPRLKEQLSGRDFAGNAPLLVELEKRLDLCPEARAAIEQTLVDEPPINATEGGVIREGFDERLDELRELARGGKAWMARYQAGEIERTGISNLKVGFNKVFGYYLEVTASQKGKVPDDYIRKQTLKNQERFITPELKEYEEKVLRAEERAVALEQDLLSTLKESVAEQTARLQETAGVLATLDTLAGLAALATRGSWCQPEITDEPILEIESGRHPVLDRLMPAGTFVPNDIHSGSRPENPTTDSSQSPELVSKPSGRRDSTGNSDAILVANRVLKCPLRSRVQIITGPNMAGKSTYIRQAALITILGQLGSFVPAAKATIGIADRIFARVGASDELGRGQSTFMVEMTETARILQAATERSLVILDEIGRGTSTYDGLSLAWAVTEHLHDVTHARTLFATHYHELTDLTQTLSNAANWNVAVREDEGEVTFLHRIVPGAANKSYGIHVAKLAGVPDSVIARARAILATLEEEHLDDQGRPNVPGRTTSPVHQQLTLFDESHPVFDRLRQLSINEMTPIAALQELQGLREQVGG